MADYDRRPRPQHGDEDTGILFASVGMALTAWELLDSALGEMFDVLVAWRPRKLSSAAGFAAYSAVTISEARIEMLRACAKSALSKYPEMTVEVLELLNTSQHYRARRNDIAHGHVANGGEFGFFLIPNNVSARGWEKDGSAKYQWASPDIEYYTQHYIELTKKCEMLVTEISKIIQDSNSTA